MPDIVEVEFQLPARRLFERDIALMDCCPPGYTGADEVPIGIEWNYFLIVSGQGQRFRTRTNPAHIADQYIEDLGELIDAPFAQHPPERRDP